MERVETTFPKLEIDIGEEKRQVVFGGSRVDRFIKDAVAGKTIDGKKYNFNEELVMEMHDRATMIPGKKSELRQTDSTRVGGDPVRAHYEELPHMMHLFGRWFGGEMERLKNEPENLIFALQIAAASHYGLTQPGFHPYDNGNGRTARALMNLVLMYQSYELTAYHRAIPPIPIVRGTKDEGHYIRSLRAVGQTGTLNPFMTFIAQKWVESLDERLDKIHHEIKVPHNDGDKGLIQKLETRRHLLQEFIKPGSLEEDNHKNGHSNGHTKGHSNGHSSGHNHYQTFPIPDFFGTRYVLFSNASETA